ncbi:MAG: hypothetical protein EBV83_09140 [Verrucomicrobia bacterium]|nr:hypothetical protein [Verrucomicrobiota bacterium]
MARKRRNCPTGVTFHLCNRSAGSLPLFQTALDYLQWGQVLREAQGRFPVSIFAYCVMPNHWHLLAQPQKPKSISRFMHWFGTTHAARYRKSHATVGHGAVYQNRFRSHAVEGPQAFLKTAAYIERNALSADGKHVVPTVFVKDGRSTRKPRKQSAGLKSAPKLFSAWIGKSKSRTTPQIKVAPLRPIPAWRPRERPRFRRYSSSDTPWPCWRAVYPGAQKRQKLPI